MYPRTRKCNYQLPTVRVKLLLVVTVISPTLKINRQTLLFPLSNGEAESEFVLLPHANHARLATNKKRMIDTIIGKGVKVLNW